MILIYGRRDAETIQYFPTDYVISITNPNSEPAKIDALNILRLEFWDTEKIRIFEDGEKYYPMTDEQADKIIEFVRGINHEFLRHIIVHCEAGVSRSAGVAGAIARYLYGDDSWVWDDLRRYPNYYCYKTVFNKLMESGIPKIKETAMNTANCTLDK